MAIMKVLETTSTETPAIFTGGAFQQIMEIDVTTDLETCFPADPNLNSQIDAFVNSIGDIDAVIASVETMMPTWDTDMQACSATPSVWCIYQDL